MTEEIKEGGEHQEQQEQVVQTELSPVEKEAIAQGWVPKDEFQGDEGKWVDAGEFIRRGELFRKIDSATRETKQTRQALAALQEHFIKMKTSEYERAKADLKREYKLANREADFDKADAIEEKLEAVEKEQKTFAEEQASIVLDEPAQSHPLFQQWVARNHWYATQPHMKVYADKVGLALGNSGLQPEELLKKVDEAVRKEFPTKFTNPNRERAGSTESPSAKSSKAKDSFEMTPQEIKVMNSLVSGKVMTKEQYIADLKKIKGVA